MNGRFREASARDRASAASSRSPRAGSEERPPAAHQVRRPSTVASTGAGVAPTAAEAQSTWFLTWQGRSPVRPTARSSPTASTKVRDGSAQLLNRPPIAVSTACFAASGPGTRAVHYHCHQSGSRPNCAPGRPSRRSAPTVRTAQPDPPASRATPAATRPRWQPSQRARRQSRKHSTNCRRRHRRRPRRPPHAIRRPTCRIGRPAAP